MQRPDLQSCDVVYVYPTRKALYKGAKWAVVSYLLTTGVKGVIDFPIPQAAGNILDVAKNVIKREIDRGVYDFTQPRYDALNAA